MKTYKLFDTVTNIEVGRIDSSGDLRTGTILLHESANQNVPEGYRVCERFRIDRIDNMNVYISKV